jgi:hypothetical protein
VSLRNSYSTLTAIVSAVVLKDSSDKYIISSTGETKGQR